MPIPPEYEPQRASEEDAALPAKAEAAKPELGPEPGPGEPRQQTPAGQGSLPPDFEYVPDSPGAHSPGAPSSSNARGLTSSQEKLVSPTAPEALSRLKAALESGCQDIQELETMLEEARQASLEAPEVPDVAAVQRRVRALRTVESIKQALASRNVEQLSKAIDEARAAGVPEAQLSKAIEKRDGFLEERRRRVEEEQRQEEKKKLEVAAGCLQSAVDTKDPEALKDAIAGAERGGMAPVELEVARKFLADLQGGQNGQGGKRSSSIGKSMFGRRAKS